MSLTEDLLRYRHRTFCAAAFCLVLLGLATAACTRTPADAAPLPRPDLSELPPAATAALTKAEQELRAANQTAPAWIQLGRFYHANGFYEQATACYTQALARDRASAEVFYLFADADRMSGDPTAERQHIAEAVRLRPDYIPAQLWHAETLSKSGQPAAAAQVYEQVLQAEPANPTAAVGLARELDRRGETAAAIALLDRVVRNQDPAAAACLLLAQILEKSGDATRVAQLRHRARARPDTLPDDLWLDSLRAVCFRRDQLGRDLEDRLNTGQIEEAAMILRRLEQVEPSHWSVARYRAEIFWRQARPVEAAAACEQALAADGDPAILYPLLVSALARTGDTARAEEQARVGLRRVPRSAELWVALAELRERAQDLNEARSCVAEALAVAPDHLEANKLLARLEWTSGARESAITRLEKIRWLDTQDLLTRAMLGQALLELGQPTRALAPLEEARAIAPENRELHHLLAFACLRSGNEQARAGDLPGAIALYDRAIAAEATLIEPYVNKATLLVREGKLDGAESAVASMLQALPGNPEAYLAAGDVIAACGRASQAREWWTRAADLLPNVGANDALRERIAARLAAGTTP